jgi:hypothetical protein
MFIEIIQILVLTITLISVILIYKTIKSNERLNQRILFGNITKEERELRIKLNEYRDKIIADESDFNELVFDYDTLLFNYYEYVSICIFQKFINELDAKLYFKILLISVKEKFDSSMLFEKDLVRKEEYRMLNWLFQKWKV